MTTFSVPFYRVTMGERVFMGVVTADVSLSWLQEIVSSIKVAHTGYGFLLSKNGTFITHPDPGLIMNETIFTAAEARGDTHMREIGREMIRGGSGFTRFKSLLTAKDCWMVYCPVSSSGWSLGVLFPQDELMEDITQLNRIVLFLRLAGFILVLVVIVLIAGTITRPLRALSSATEHVAKGNLDFVLPSIRSEDEVGRLAQSFGTMMSSLKRYLVDLTEATAANERIESELKIAHRSTAPSSGCPSASLSDWSPGTNAGSSSRLARAAGRPSRFDPSSGGRLDCQRRLCSGVADGAQCWFVMRVRAEP
jgi:sigma-B regulation protein RsbU (phosphoserine phosphatase)